MTYRRESSVSANRWIQFTHRKRIAYPRRRIGCAQQCYEGTVEARVVDDPVPGPGQLLVRSLACGICASDLHFMDNPDAGIDDDSGMSTYDHNVDIVMGHEYCAEVVDYGPGTDRKIPIGTRVSSLPVLATTGDARSSGRIPNRPVVSVSSCFSTNRLRAWLTRTFPAR